jgi:hypothetical protein
MTATAEKTATLDERIASALGSSEPLSSEFLADLLSEVDQAIDHCDQTSREGRAAAIDPKRLDCVAQRARAEDAEFYASRYRAGEAKLKELQAAALSSEAQARWEQEAVALRSEVDEIAAYFKRVYSETAGHLVGVLEKMASIDQEVDALNSRAPAGVNWLRRTEAVARGIPRVNGKPIVMQIALPKLLGFDYPENAPLAWPPVAVNHALEYYHAVSAAITHAPPPPTDAERIAASERQMQFVAEQERGRERLAAEAARAAGR